jgi:catecholate siderophore receptor
VARLFVLGAAVAATTTAGAATAATVTRGMVAVARPAQAPAATGVQAVRFDIAPGRLEDVVRAFEAATGMRLTATRADVLTLASPGVTGLFEPLDALQRLLEGTGVGFTLTGASTAALDVAAFAEQVSVRVAGPAVVSPKFTEPLRDIPQTITVVPAAIIEAQGASTLRDVLRNVTGISIQTGEGGVPAGDNLSIRGFSARTDFFVDGMRDSGGYSRDPFNVEQVEVIKGPSSSYAGRGSTGGAINLATKSPFLGSSRNVALSVGSSAYRRGTLDFNAPLPNTAGAAFRVNAMWTDSGTPGRDVVESGRWAIAPSLAFGLGTPTRVTLSYSHMAEDNVPDYGIPWVPANSEVLADYADQAAPVDYANFYGLASRDYEHTRNDIATVALDHDMNAVASLRTVVRYGLTARDSLITAPRFQGTDSTEIRRTDWKSRDQTDGILASQTDLTSRFETGTAAHTLVTGIEVTRETEENFNRIETGGAPPGTDLFAPDPGQPYASRLVRNGEVDDAVARSAAAYAFDTVTFNERFELNGGLRWDRFALDYREVAADLSETAREQTDTMLSWRAGAVFHPRPEGSIYAGLGTSLNPSTEGLALSANNAGVDPERTRSVEMGTKWDLLDGRLGINAAAFYTEKTDARTPGLNPGDPPVVLNGEHRVAGFEMGASGMLGDAVQVIGGYTVMDSLITASNDDRELGQAFGNTPKHSLSLWSSVWLPADVQVGGGVQYVGDRSTNNRAQRLAPGYWLVDAMAAYRVTERLTLRVNGHNLADERYIDRIGGGHFIPGPGRSVQFSTDIGF